MVVVVPALSKRNQSAQKVVAAFVVASERTTTPQMADRIDAKGQVLHEKYAHQTAPKKSKECSEPGSGHQAAVDAGAGDVIVESPSPMGLGRYTIRFTLAGRTVDLQTWYPPGTREEREAIFVETRRLKADLRFAVNQASVSVENPEEGVVGTLRYTLADGRTVSIVEQIPADAVTPDGTFVVVPDAGETLSVELGGTWTAPDGSQYTMGGSAEFDSLDE